MREVKFRAWDKFKKEMRKIDKMDFHNEKGIIVWFLNGEKILYPKQSAEIMQFTGLKDCNNKEIYEGDILKSSRGRGSYVCVVRDSPSFAGFEFKLIKAPDGGEWQIGDSFLLSELRINEAEYKIIGNIYENSELLK